MKDKKEIFADFAQTVFVVFGGLCMFFSGFVVKDNFQLSFILLIIGILSLLIRFEYTKEEAVTE